jgi:DNA invertase Pin-like site-specific DNA recombinase
LATFRVSSFAISRFARSLRQISEIVELPRKKDVVLHAINGGWSINGGHESKVVLCMLGLFAEEERDLVSLRTKEALAARRASGVKSGRPNGLGKSRTGPFRPEIIAFLRNGLAKSFVAKRYKVSEPTLDNLFN